MQNPSYPELALGNIINFGNQTYESIPGFSLQKSVGYFEVDPTNPRLIHQIRVPYTGNYEITRPDNRIALSGSRVLYGVGIRVPAKVDLTGVTALTLKTDMPPGAFITPFPHAPRNLFTAQLGLRVGAMNSATNPVVTALQPFWNVDSVQGVVMSENPFASFGVLAAPSETDATMIVESNVPITVLGKRDKMLRVVVEFYTCGLSSTAQLQDLWGYNNTLSEV